MQVLPASEQPRMYAFILSHWLWILLLSLSELMAAYCFEIYNHWEGLFCGGSKTNTNYKQNLNCGRSIEQWCYDEYDNDYECDVLALLHWLRLVLFLNSKIFFIFAEISFFPWKKYWKMPSLCLTRGYICKLKQYKQLKRVMVGLLFLLVVSILHVMFDE